MNDSKKGKSKAWIINLNESDNLIFGEVTSEYRVNENLVEYLAEGDDLNEYDRIEAFLKKAIVAITPNQDIILSTMGYVPYEVKYHRSWFIRVIDTFIIETYEYLVINSLKAIFQIKNKKFINHRNKLIRYHGRENNNAFLREIQNDNIPILQDDEQGGYYIRLKKSQLHKYLFNDQFGPKVESIAVPLVSNHLLTEFDLNFLAYPGINHRLDKDQLLIIKSIMQDHLIIGTFIEDVYYFVAHKQFKNQIIKPLEDLAKENNLTISWE